MKSDDNAREPYSTITQLSQSNFNNIVPPLMNNTRLRTNQVSIVENSKLVALSKGLGMDALSVYLSPLDALHQYHVCQIHLGQPQPPYLACSPPHPPLAYYSFVPASCLLASENNIVYENS